MPEGGRVQPPTHSAGGPDRTLSQERYGAHAASYDRDTAPGLVYRNLTVAQLALRSGEVVVEVGCGTGLNFEGLQARVGPAGRIIGVELSGGMLAQARSRVQENGWRNVTLIEASAEEAELPEAADAALFCATHDVMRSPEALANILSQVANGAQVVAGGPRLLPRGIPWSSIVNAWTRRVHGPYVTTWEGFDQPWSHLERLIEDLEVEPVLFGAGYIAHGRVRHERRRPLLSREASLAGEVQDHRGH
jgi:SAM-dependent methyltransferase